MKAIAARGLVQRFGKRAVLSGIDLDLEAGEALRPEARHEQQRDAQDENQERRKAHGQAPCAHLPNERPKRSAAAMPDEQMPVALKRRVA